MIQFLVAAPCSGSGKTTLTCALLAALKRRGQEPCSFKSGPDYIDPMFHRAVLGVESHTSTCFSPHRRPWACSMRRPPPGTGQPCARVPWAFTMDWAA